ncbi:MAG: hypothetical protein ED859_14770 [Desulfuromonadales bacterium]|nr:MAG: hypothetical protein ED859_14770 [Desulfuromonadales bacterium]
MFCVFLALVFVKQAEDTPSHFTGRIVTRLLSDGNELHARLFELPLVEAELDGVTEEAGETVHYNCFVGRRDGAGLGDHLLKDWPTVIGCRGSRLDVFHGNAELSDLAPLLHLAELVRDRKLFFRLLSGGYSRIERHYHDIIPPRSALIPLTASRPDEPERA